jgi:hypothetical protein
VPYPALTDLNLTPVAQRLACLDAPPEPDLRLRFDKEPWAQAGGRSFELVDPGVGQVLVERGRVGRPYLVLTVACRPTHQDQPRLGSLNTVVFDEIGNEWLAVDVS